MARVLFGGAGGELTQALRSLASLEPDERRTVGAAANSVKAVLEERLAGAEEAVKVAQLEALAEQGRIDVTLPGRTLPAGVPSPHYADGAGDLRRLRFDGFPRWWRARRWSGTTTTLRCSTSPKTTPARDMWDTLWIDYQDENGERAHAASYTHLAHADTHYGGPASRPLGWWCPASATATRPRTPPTSGTSTRLRAWPWTTASPSPI